MKKAWTIKTLMVASSIAITSSIAATSCSNHTTSLESATYEQLKNKKENNQLIPGQQYRLTDYEATVKTTEVLERISPAKAAPKQLEFDLILTALSTNTFSENVYVDSKPGYDGSINFNAWTVKYSFDNNKDVYSWADDDNGKGVIYYMKAEFNNECPYDFKNIQMLVGEIYCGESVSDWLPDDIYRYTFSS